MFGQYLNWTARIQKELSLIITGDIRSKTNTLPISNTEYIYLKWLKLIIETINVNFKLIIRCDS